MKTPLNERESELLLFAVNEVDKEQFRVGYNRVTRMLLIKSKADSEVWMSVMATTDEKHPYELNGGMASIADGVTFSRLKKWLVKPVAHLF